MDKTPELKLWHFPLAMLYLGGMLVVLVVLITVAVIFSAAATIAFVVAVMGVLLISFPFLLWTEYRKKHAEAHRHG